MPAFSTHYIFSDEMMDTIRQRAKGVKVDERAVIYGTQGPDFLFFHRLLPNMPGKSLMGTGSAIHRSDPAKLFAAMAEYLINGKNYDRDCVISYFCGFICHYALDRSVHPFVYWAMEDIKKREHITYHPFVLHNRIEFNIDMLLLKEKKNIENTLKFSTKALLSDNPELIENMARAASFAFSVTLKLSCDEKKFEQAFRDFRYMQGIINSGNKKRNDFLKAVQLPLYPVIGPGVSSMMLQEKADDKYDYMNRAKNEWYYPADKSVKLNKSVYELFDETKEDAAQMITGFMNILEGKADSSEVFGHRSFLTGTDVC